MTLVGRVGENYKLWHRKKRPKMNGQISVLVGAKRSHLVSGLVRRRRDKLQTSQQAEKGTK